MILQQCITLGLAFVVSALAEESGAQHPITEHAIQTSGDCHNAVYPSSSLQNTNINKRQCTELVTVLGAQASYGTLPEDFKTLLYCSRQRDVTPACVVRPQTAQDVSLAVKTIAKHNCHFAIKSGGHAMFAGASNADGGITIDLVNLNVLELSEDLMTASVGPGQRWGKVYEFLEEKGRVVIGGRVSSVGVGGFLLGGKSCDGGKWMQLMRIGGISFLSRKYGWASDNVRNYEVRTLCDWSVRGRTEMYRSSSPTAPSPMSITTPIRISIGLSAAALGTSGSLLALILNPTSWDLSGEA